MESDRQAFLAAIESSPLDLAPRMVFADWLDEQGQYDEATEQRQWTIERLKSRQWIIEFAGQYGFSFDDMMEGAKNGALYGGENLEGEHVPDEFWDHYILVVGKIPDNRVSFFRCAC